MRMLFGFAAWSVVLAEFHPGRSIVRDDQRTRASQLIKNSGIETAHPTSDSSSLANLFGSTGYGRKEMDERSSESKYEGRNDTEEKDGPTQEEGRYFVPSDDELKKLEERLPQLCPMDDCEAARLSLDQLAEKLCAGNGNPEEPCCCTDTFTIDLPKLNEILINWPPPGPHDGPIDPLKPICGEEGLYQAVNTASGAYKDLHPPAPYRGPSPLGGGDASGPAAAEPAATATEDEAEAGAGDSAAAATAEDEAGPGDSAAAATAEDDSDNLDAGDRQALQRAREEAEIRDE